MAVGSAVYITEDDGVTKGGEEKPFADLDKESFERSTQIPPTPELQEVKRVWEETGCAAG